MYAALTHTPSEVLHNMMQGGVSSEICLTDDVLETSTTLKMFFQVLSGQSISMSCSPNRSEGLQKAIYLAKKYDAPMATTYLATVLESHVKTDYACCDYLKLFMIAGELDIEGLVVATMNKALRRPHTFTK
jgi:hypothetical protein